MTVKTKKPEDLPKTKPVLPKTTTPAEEWGAGVETGRDIARAGAETGKVAGATGDDTADSADPRSGK